MVLLSGKLGLLLLQTLTFVIFKTYVKLLNFEFMNFLILKMLGEAGNDSPMGMSDLVLLQHLKSCQIINDECPL